MLQIQDLIDCPTNYMDFNYIFYLFDQLILYNDNNLIIEIDNILEAFMEKSSIKDSIYYGTLISKYFKSLEFNDYIYLNEKIRDYRYLKNTVSIYLIISEDIKDTCQVGYHTVLGHTPYYVINSILNRYSHINLIIIKNHIFHMEETYVDLDYEDCCMNYRENID